MSDEENKELKTEPKKRGRKPKTKIDNEEKQDIKMVSTSQIASRMASIFNNNKSISIDNYIKAMSTMYQTNNPFIQNQRIKRTNAPFIKNSKEDIAKALESPDNSESLFRSESQTLYFQNYVYNNLLKLNREIPMYFNYVLPCNVSLKDCKSEEFKNEMNFVENFVSKLNLRKVGKDIAMNVAIEGKRSYVFRTSFSKKTGKVYFANLQKLPSEWIKYTGIGSSTDYITSFDFMMFLQPGESIDNYPPFFKKIWQAMLTNKIIILKDNDEYEFVPENANKMDSVLEYKNDRYMYWIDLPQNEVYEFGSDNSNPLQIPDYVGLFTDFRGLDDYKWLQNQLMSRAINSIVVGTVPLIKNTTTAGADETAISMDSIIGFSDMFSQAVSSNVMPFFAPFVDYQLFSLPLPPDAKEVVNTSLKNLINSSGMGALITTTDKPSIVSVKTAQQVSESKAEYVMLQVQACINNYINKKLGLKYQYKTTIWGGKFTYMDELKYLKELLISGVSSVLPRILSAENQSVNDFDATNNYMDSLKIYDRMKPFSTLNREEIGVDKNKEIDTGEEKKKGRKPVGNDIENDNTGNSLDQGTNVSDIKDFSKLNDSQLTCLICGNEIDENENKICDDCLDNLYQDRLQDLLNN